MCLLLQVRQTYVRYEQPGWSICPMRFLFEKEKAFTLETQCRLYSCGQLRLVICTIIRTPNVSHSPGGCEMQGARSRWDFAPLIIFAASTILPVGLIRFIVFVFGI